MHGQKAGEHCVRCWVGGGREPRHHRQVPRVVPPPSGKGVPALGSGMVFSKSYWDRSVLGISDLITICNSKVINRARQTKALLCPVSVHLSKSHRWLLWASEEKKAIRTTSSLRAGGGWPSDSRRRGFLFDVVMNLLSKENLEESFQNFFSFRTCQALILGQDPHNPGLWIVSASA